ncbi:MAG TPA: glycolate oxidase subunit GlcF [Xanthobacteraceae bacterium]|jgi:glycolate oxidase iron-sulfur subunit|nr:glycolate oxidase subunit GlcF [Xanthobacteraceae bacterium]
MQTSFSLAQLADPKIAASNDILRTCVHCGFCTATCPTYVLLGEENDGPRGRIYLIKEMFENDRPATAETVKHIDRCLSCLACMTTCPSGVHYMHLVDHARAHIEATYRRPLPQRWLRSLLAKVLPYPDRFRLALIAGFLAKPLAPLFALLGLRRMAALLRLVPAPPPVRPPVAATHTHSVEGVRKGRVILLDGCVNPVLSPNINAATVRVLHRAGIEVVVPPNVGCCGSLVHHMGREDEALNFARRAIDAWAEEHQRDPIDAILITASGCGTTIKDYGFMLREDKAYADKAAWASRCAKDVSEYLATVSLTPRVPPRPIKVAYHSACSLQNGQKIFDEPKELLSKYRFVVEDVPEGHLCCGSAGTYNIFEPQLARRLLDRKAANIALVQPDVIAAGNIGCITQIAKAVTVPIVHTVELVDWATGGPAPKGLSGEWIADGRHSDDKPIAGGRVEN